MGSGGNNSPELPKEMTQMWQYGQPLAERISTAGVTGQPLWNVPDMPTVPGPVMPTSGWFQGIAPEVRQGLWEPWQEAGKALTEQFQGQGQVGSARGGYSGAFGAAMGELASKAGQQVGLQAWQMTSPQLMDYRNQLYTSALQQRGDYMQAAQAPYTLFPGYIGSTSGLPYYQQQNQMSPWVGALGGAATGATAGSAFGPYGTAAGAALGGIYGYYANR